MCKKFIYFIPFVLVLVLACNASAATDVEWVGGSDSNLWSVPENWNPVGVPTSDNYARIDIVDANCVIDDTVTNAECYAFYVGYDAAPCYLNMTGGTLTVTGVTCRIGSQSDSNGVFNMSGGTVDLQGKRLWIGYNEDANGTLIITGDANMTVGDKIECGKNGGGFGQIFIEGGTLNLAGYGSDDLELGKYGTGIITITGGELNITDNMKLGQGGGIGKIYLYGGTLNNGNDEPIIGDNPESFIDITEGTLVLSGNATGPIDTLVGQGKVKAYGGLGRIIASYDAGEDVTTVTAITGDPNLAWNENPRNFSTIDWTPAGPTLSWSPGENAVKHDVYVGTNRDDVNDANRAVHPGLLYYNENQDPCSYGPITVDIGTTYYWRIDEVNGTTIWKGNIWQFTVNNYLVVDDMDEYGDEQTPGEPGGRIYYVWRDGWDIGPPPYDVVTLPGNLTGSQVYHWWDVNPPADFSESGIVRSGLSMPFYYENDGDTNSKPMPISPPIPNPDNDNMMEYSEASAKTVGPNSLPDIDEDWTVGDVKALSLWFYGDPNNDANATEQMYVALEDGDNPSHLAVVEYDGDMNDIRKIEWQEWNIDLALFTDVNLANVQKIYIGFGDREEPASGGKGIVYFDDIRLYPARCVPARLQPTGDLDDDCDADYDDLDVMAEDWLESDYTGPGSDGVLMNFPNDDSQWVDDPCRGQCLQFDGTDDWVNLADDEFSDFQDKTISLWVKISNFPDPYPYVFCFQNAGDAPYRIYIRTRGTDTVRARFVEDYLPNFTVETEWHHLAFVVRNTGSDTCTGEFYGDGTLVGELTGRPRHTGGAKGVNLGSFNDGTGPFIQARYDEFRVYDDALDLNEIKYLAEVAGGVAPTAGMLLHYEFDDASGQIATNSSTYEFNRPLTSVAELYAGEAEGSRKVNFKDLAMLAADQWLEGTLLWPQP